MNRGFLGEIVGKGELGREIRFCKDFVCFSFSFEVIV